MNDIAALISQDAAASGPTDKIDELLAEFIQVDASIKATELQLEEAKKQRNKLQMELLPEAMMAARKKKLVMQDGAVLSLRDFLAASLPSQSKIREESDPEVQAELAERRQAGLSWLRENNGGAIIKNELTIDIPKGNDNVVSQVITVAEELGLPWSRAENVHAKTLESFLREKIKQPSSNIPAETFRLVVGQKAHYKPAKAKD